MKKLILFLVVIVTLAACEAPKEAQFVYYDGNPYYPMFWNYGSYPFWGGYRVYHYQPTHYYTPRVHSGGGRRH